MGWAEDDFRRQMGVANAAQAAAPSQQSVLGGFTSSTVSSLGEMFGADPFPTAETFRQEHPWLGLGSELVGTLTPYGIVGRLSATARGAELLEGSLARIMPKAITAETAPIRFGMAKEMLRYSPVEISRLGIGAFVADDSDQYKNLLADVGLSSLITGGFGGIGGFFRAGGKELPKMGRVVDADLAFKPTFEYRMSRAPGATVTGDFDIADVQNHLFRQIWTERPFEGALPGQKQSYVSALEGGTPETTALVDQLFRPSGEKASKASLLRQPLMKRDGTWALEEGEKTEMLAGLGFKSMEDLAESVVYPRRITVNSERAAGTISKALEDSAMQWVAPGVMMSKETQGGLFVVMKRLKAGTATDGPILPVKTAKKASVSAPTEPPKIGAGDQWFIAKTDQPHLFAPKAMSFAKQTVSQFAKYREAWQPKMLDDLFNRDSDRMLETFSPADYRDIATKSKSAAMSSIMERVNKQLAKTVPGLEGTKGSTVARNLAEQFYDIVAPTVVKEGRDSLYARLFGLLNNSMRVSRTTVNKMIGGAVETKGSPLFRKNLQHDQGLFGIKPVQQIMNSMSDEERQLYALIKNSPNQLDTLKALEEEHLVSDTLRAAVNDMVSLDKTVWQEHLLPAFRNAEIDAKFDLVEGYIGPRLFKGDWFVPVVDEAGNAQWLASGTLLTAKRDAQYAIDEAAKRGQLWKMEKPRSIADQKSPDAISNLHDLVQLQIGKSAETQEIIQNAMKRMAVERYAAKTGKVVPSFHTPKTLLEKRTGMSGSPDLEYVTAQDLIKDIESHYLQLYKFAGYSTWKNRWYTEALNLEKINPTLAEDLRRKANQLMGYEGQITQTLNRALTPILGPVMGGKAATRIAQATNELMYNWNLAIANPTFALTNALSPLQTTLPHIAFLQLAPIEQVERNMHMFLRHGADGKPREIAGILDAPKVMARAWKEMGAPDDVLKEHFGRAKTDGTLLAQLFEGFVGGQSRAHETLRDAFKNAGGGVAGGWEFIKRTATFLAERSEEWSRIQAFTAYHVLGRDYFKLEGDALYRFAQRGTHNSMFGYSVIDRSRMFTGPIGSMFGLFKNWQMHFISSMVQYAGLAVRDGVFAPMLWQFGVAGAIGGLGAMGPLKWTADALAKMKDNDETAYTWLQNNWEDSADEIYFGLPATFGATLQASASLPGTDVRNDITSLSSFVFLERAKRAGMAVGDAWDYAQANGQNPIQDPNIRDKMLNAFAPRALFRAFSSAEGDYIKSMSSGYPHVRGVSPTSKFLYGMGLNQVEVEQQQIASKELWRDQERRRTLIAQLGIALADAQLNGDWDEMERINNRAVMYGLEPSKVYKSAQTRVRRETQGDILSRYDPAQVERYTRATAGQ